MDEVLALACGDLRCLVARRGAELRSLACAGDEFIWQRGAAWTDSAPILFPVVGRLKGGEYSHQGGRFHLPIHGFARGALFDVAARRADSVTLVLRETEATLESYPFRFELKVCFTLTERSLQVRYEVSNPGTSALLFSLGSHPGLRLPDSTHGLSDWSLEFDGGEMPVCFRLDGHLLAAAPSPLAFAAPGRIALSPSLFDADALIFKRIRSRQVRLVHNTGGIRLSMDTGAAPSLGLWAHPGAPYVCIEPWHGYDDDHAVSGELADKPGIVSLAPCALFATGYSLEIPA
ncbi:aldose epimerase [Massilia eurypsychrophila]|jgi:galactose mutarotase-like enzyme|uniref:Aldose epimerase n=1 Tax=Massilia eurypsychrophila TaxID=1485217 RepID=A0A2G8T8U1_9BURK|nr:aldose 1-epimerase family protein [Massilia eurypsychrophila]PIL42470.1 aldose epimerase [Massilia eurypsychrophila]